MRRKTLNMPKICTIYSQSSQESQLNSIIIPLMKSKRMNLHKTRLGRISAPTSWPRRSAHGPTRCCWPPVRWARPPTRWSCARCTTTRPSRRRSAGWTARTTVRCRCRPAPSAGIRPSSPRTAARTATLRRDSCTPSTTTTRTMWHRSSIVSSKLMLLIQDRRVGTGQGREVGPAVGAGLPVGVNQLTKNRLAICE